MPEKDMSGHVFHGLSVSSSKFFPTFQSDIRRQFLKKEASVKGTGEGYGLCSTTEGPKAISPTGGPSQRVIRHRRHATREGPFSTMVRSSHQRTTHVVRGLSDGLPTLSG